MNRDSKTVLSEWLVINSQMGDAVALEQLLSIWYPRLLSYAVHLLNADAAAHDVTQLTLISVSRDIQKVRDPASFPKWTFQLLRNKCADHLKQNLRAKSVHSAFFQHMQTYNQEMKAVGELVQFDLAELKPDERQLLYLHYYEEFSLLDIAHILSLPVGTVKSRLYAIRQQLRAML